MKTHKTERRSDNPQSCEPPGNFQVRLDHKYGGQWIPKLGQRNLRNVDAYRILVDPNTRPPWTEVFLDREGRPQTREQLLKRFRGRYDAKDPEHPAGDGLHKIRKGRGS